MAPVLIPGDHVYIDLWAYRSTAPELGQVVVFDFPKDPQKKFMKRVVGLPGDMIEIRRGRIYRNGLGSEVDCLPQPYAPARTLPGEVVPDKPGWFRERLGEVTYSAVTDVTEPRPHLDVGPRQVPEGSYFVVGDNRDRSNDSRFWGSVKREAIRGRVREVAYSWDSQAFRLRWERFGKALDGQ